MRWWLWYGAEHATTHELAYFLPPDARRARAPTSNKSSEECHKEDVYNGAIGFEIVIERSSPNDGQTVFLWENSKDKFAVWRHSRETSKRGRWVKLHEHEGKMSEAEARKAYAEECGNCGCEPYPEVVGF